mgnify:CR=1 FL=1
MVRLSLCVVSGRGIGSQFGPGRDETVTRSRRVGVDVEAEPSGEKSLDFIVDHLSPRERGELAETPEQLFRRVAHTIARAATSGA